MATLFISVIGARVVIATDDHCSPHVHALHRGEEWIVRLSFSDVTVEAGVLSIAPTEQAVRQRQLNQLLDEVEAYVAKCRRVWWEIKGTTCLPNKWVLVDTAGLTMLDSWRAGARQIKAAFYDSDADATRIMLQSGGEMTITSNQGDST